MKRTVSLQSKIAEQVRFLSSHTVAGDVEVLHFQRSSATCPYCTNKVLIIFILCSCSYLTLLNNNKRAAEGDENKGAESIETLPMSVIITAQSHHGTFSIVSLKKLLNATATTREYKRRIKTFLLSQQYNSH